MPDVKEEEAFLHRDVNTLKSVANLSRMREGLGVFPCHKALEKSFSTSWSVTGNALSSFSLRYKHQTGGQKVSSMTVYSLVLERISQVASTGEE